VLAITSEPPRYARLAQEEWEIRYPVMGDPQNRLSHHLIDKGLVPDLLVLDRFDRARSLRNQEAISEAAWTWFTNHPYLKHYLHGCVQPSVAIVRRNCSVAYSLAVKELSLKNGFGATTRPVADEVWAAFKALAPGAGRMEGTGFRRHALTEEAYIQCLLFASVSVPAVAVLYLLDLAGAQTCAALLCLATAYGISRWHGFLRELLRGARRLG